MGKKLVSGLNDLASRHPELAKEWDYDLNLLLRPEDVSAGSHSKVFWKCQVGHSFVSGIGNRARGSGCPYCAGNKVLEGFNDLATTHPELALEWDYERNGPITPNLISFGYGKKTYWLCDKGHSLHAAPRSRRAANCPVCSGKSASAGFNDLATLRPEIALEWDYQNNNGKTPQEVRPGSNKKAAWLCKLGHPYTATINDRCRPKGSGCPFCSGNAVLEGFNDIATTNKTLATEWDHSRNGDAKPSHFSIGSRTKIYWMCQENHSYQATISDRQSGTGCPKCARYGYDPNSEALFYFIENTVLMARKVGITNTNGTVDRVERYGIDWALVFSITNRDGRLVRELERRTLSWIRDDLGLPKYLNKRDAGLRTGHTETFSSQGASNKEIIAKVKEIYADLNT